MHELLDTLAGWSAEGAGIGRAVVVRTFGSAPRPEGAVLLVTDDGRIAGSVSGGCVEGAAAEEIWSARASGRERVIRYGISDEQAWDVGLACGGTIDVLISPRVPEAAVLAARETREGRGDGRAIVTPLPADAPPPAFGAAPPGEGSAPVDPLVVHDDGRLDGTLGDPALDEALVAAATDAPRARRLADRGARRSPAVHRGLPGPAAAGRGRRRRGVAHARPAREGAGL